MKTVSFLLTLVFVFSLFSCSRDDIENNYYYGEQNGSSTNTTDTDNDDSDDDTGSSATEYSGVMTVAQAQTTSIYDIVTVGAYVVGSCQKSMKYADFEAPFEGSTAILLADQPIDSATFMPTNDDSRLFPVRINDYSKVRSSINLVDNPQFWNTYIVIRGERIKYLNRAGLGYVDHIESDLLTDDE